MAEPLKVKVSVKADAVVRRFGALAGEKLDQALRSGLSTALDLGASGVVGKALERGVQSRSGTLLNEIRGRLEEGDEPGGFVGVPDESPARKYAGLLTAGGIRPTTKKALTIPIAENLTGAGVARFASVAALEAAFPSGVVRVKRLLGVSIEGEFTPFFLLSKHVRGRDALEPGLDEAQPEMVGAVQDSVDKLTADS